MPTDSSIVIMGLIVAWLAVVGLLIAGIWDGVKHGNPLFVVVFTLLLLAMFFLTFTWWKGGEVP